MFPTNKDFNSTTLTLRERVPRDHRANLLDRSFLQRSSSGLNLSRYFDGLEGIIAFIGAPQRVTGASCYNSVQSLHMIRWTFYGGSYSIKIAGDEFLGHNFR